MNTNVNEQIFNEHERARTQGLVGNDSKRTIKIISNEHERTEFISTNTKENEMNRNLRKEHERQSPCSYTRLFTHTEQ